MVVGGCATQPTRVLESDRSGTLGRTGLTVQQFPAASREPVGPFTGTLLDGGAFDSETYAGQVTVYNVWGSWCGPCRKEAPELREAWEKVGDQVAFVGINVRDNDAAAIAFEERYGIDYPSIDSATSDAALLAFGSYLPPNAIPSTVIVDADGTIAGRIIGPTTAATLLGLLEDATGVRPPAPADTPDPTEEPEQ